MQQVYLLSPPFKIQELLELYAIVVFKHIPIAGVDGIAINIKVPGKTPLVIINQDISDTRQRFTMAHELGHLIIPWHTGIKIDKDENDFYSKDSYSVLETEANRFAAELLMPGPFIKEIAAQSLDLAKAHRKICSRLKVSHHAAAIQISNTFPPGVIYCAVKNGVVDYGGQTKGTSDNTPYRNQVFSEKWYPLAIKRSFWTINDLSIYWWEMVPDLTASATEIISDWRQLLNEIVRSIKPEFEGDRYKKSVNGIIANINGKKRQTDEYTLDSLLHACHQRFDTDEHAEFKNHPDFNAFLELRMSDFLKTGRSSLNKDKVRFKSSLWLGVVLITLLAEPSER